MRFALTALLVFSSFEVSALAQPVDIVEQHVSVDLTSPVPRFVISARVEGRTSSPHLIAGRFSVPIVDASVDGEPIEIVPHPTFPEEAIIMSWDEPLTPEQGAWIEMILEGEINCRSIYSFGARACEVGPELTYLIPHWGGVVWYLMNAEVQDGFEAEVSITVPEGQWAASCEGFPEIEETPGAITFNYRHDHIVDSLWLYAGPVERVISDIDVPVEGLFVSSSGAREEMVQQGVDVRPHTICQQLAHVACQ
jgi:hypothetical protein